VVEAEAREHPDAVRREELALVEHPPQDVPERIRVDDREQPPLAPARRFPAG
jgi:hypothetical protein